jgi:glycosyltransferase involved in cell wall biosynthesis
MKIALISKLWEETGRTAKGGTGVGVGLLADGLVEKGHDVTLFATGDSKTRAKLISVVDKSFGDNYDESLNYLHLANAFLKASQFDIIHCHVEHKSLFFAPLVTTPTLHTIRYGEFFENEKKVLEAYRQQNFVAISYAVKRMFPFLNWQGVIYNGIDISDFPLNPKPESDLLIFNGRMSSQKGPHVAIEVAKRLGMRLEMIGKVAPFDQAYLEEKVWPHVDGKQIKYRGMMKFEEKVKFMGKGLALLHPVAYEEAFGFVLLEAQARGTPVVAFDKGAVSEIIEDGKTGFVVENIFQMVEAVKKVEKIKRADCRSHIAKNFSTKKMVDGYEAIYSKLLVKNGR